MNTTKTIGRVIGVSVGACLLALGVYAQAPTSNGDALYSGSQRRPVEVRTVALYERYDDAAGELQQVTLPLSVTLPLARGLGLSVRTQYVSAGGASGSDSLVSVAGTADTQLGLSYYRAFGPGSAVFTLGANLPSGQRELTRDEAETAFLVGQGFYGFSLPTFGQGFSVSPGVTYAFPLGERLAAGLGASYQVRGAFRPRGDLADDYDPGDEIVVTGGLDYRAGPAATLSFDLTYVTFGADTFGELEYESGDVVAVTAQARAMWQSHDFRLLGRLRTKGDSERSVVAGTVVGADTSIPAQGRALAHVALRLTDRVRLGVLAQTRYYDASELFDEARLVADFGLGPELRLARQLTLLGRARLSVGDVSGFAVGGGIAWTY